MENIKGKYVSSFCEKKSSMAKYDGFEARSVYMSCFEPRESISNEKVKYKKVKDRRVFDE